MTEKDDFFKMYAALSGADKAALDEDYLVTGQGFIRYTVGGVARVDPKDIFKETSGEQT